MPAAVPSVGQIVRVRHRQYLVEEVCPPPGRGSHPGPHGRRGRRQPGRIRECSGRLSGTPTVARGRWVWGPNGNSTRRTCRRLLPHAWNRTATDPRLFQAPYRAGIHIDAYQLEPLRKALLLPRVNLFIADDVGLGKTIEAGLIARELLLRKKVRDIVVACPPSVLPQWQDELETRFGLTFQVLDRDYVLTARRERGYATNPWATHTRFLISHRLLIDESYRARGTGWD